VAFSPKRCFQKISLAGGGQKNFQPVCSRGVPLQFVNRNGDFAEVQNQSKDFRMSKIAVLSTTPNPPSSLGEPGAKLWRAIMKQYVIRDAGGLAILEQACISRDRSTSFAAIIKRDGAMVRGTAAMREHPLIKHEREERALESRLLQKLGLNVEAVRSSVGRPGKTIGVTLEDLSHDDDPHAAYEVGGSLKINKMGTGHPRTAALADYGARPSSNRSSFGFEVELAAPMGPRVLINGIWYKSQ